MELLHTQFKFVGKTWAPAHVDPNNVACHLEYIMNSGNTVLQKGYPPPPEQCSAL